MKRLVVVLSLLLGACAVQAPLTPQQQLVLACQGADHYVRTLALRVANGSVSLEDAESFNAEYLPVIKTFCLAEEPPTPSEGDLEALSNAILQAEILAGE